MARGRDPGPPTKPHGGKLTIGEEHVCAGSGGRASGWAGRWVGGPSMSHTPTCFRLALLALCRRSLADQVPAILIIPQSA